MFLSQAAGFSTGAFPIAILGFDVIGAIDDVTHIAFSDACSGWAGGGINFPVTYIDGQVLVTTVQVPTAAWLFGSGTLGFNWGGKKVHVLREVVWTQMNMWIC